MRKERRLGEKQRIESARVEKYGKAFSQLEGKGRGDGGGVGDTGIVESGGLVERDGRKERKCGV